MNNIKYIKKWQKKITYLVTKEFPDYYLTGGTALSFYYNHRFSEDLDFFSQTYKKKDPNKIMDFIKEKIGFKFKLEREQNSLNLVPMKIYFLKLKKDCVLKIDFVQDFEENIKKIKQGLHSVDDIYYRKILAAIGQIKKQDATGRVIHTGRQSAKDLFDIYYLSKFYCKLSDFFFEYFSYDKCEALIEWYSG
ncbi:MAG: nucleotidyl transferase AbiEii/AbiGii toxin family protein, partial [Candidatus Omnitrophica bacterium]|nr:nucleotidyl transferase AbiEii/AbiGii toxin family protein [Candidatus Omnitrophota bacterium]